MDPVAAEQVERVNRRDVDVKPAVNPLFEKRQQRQENHIDDQQVSKICLAAVLCDHPVKRHQQVQPDQKVEIPQMRPACPREQLVKPLQERPGRQGLVVHEDVKDAEDHAEHHKQYGDAEHIFAEQLLVAQFLCGIQKQRAGHHHEARHRPHHAVGHRVGDDAFHSRQAVLV